MIAIQTGSAFLVGTVCGAVLISGTAYAATGGSFVLGRANQAGAQTSLTNSGSGPTLALSTRSGQVPLAVSAGAGKALNLNADRVDGIDGAQLALVSGQVGYMTAVSQPVDVDEDGVMDALAAYAECPSGTRLTGGGFEDYTPASGFISSPTDNGWLYVGVLTDDPTDVLAHATCYNPRGGVQSNRGSLRRADTPPPLTDDQKRAILAKE